MSVSAGRPPPSADSFLTRLPLERGGAGPASAERQLPWRGAGPSLLLLEGPLVAALPAWLLEGKGHKAGARGRARSDFTSRLVLAFFKTSCVLVS